MKRIPALAAIAILLAFPSALSGALAQAPTEDDPISPALEAELEQLSADEMIGVIVTLKDQVDLDALPAVGRASRLRALVSTLKGKAAATQGPITGFLASRQAHGEVLSVTPLWIFNGLAVTATANVVRDLAARGDVLRVTTNEAVAAPAPSSASTAPEPNIALVNAPRLWDLGLRGQGVVVANMDTGVDLSHPDLMSRWRGGTNSWYDPNGQHPTTPTDLNGHGTATMGVMVGGDQGGTSIGVAPEARWIAVKIFNDQGSATTARIHQGFQWLLDPDGSTSTPDAPNVVNNSWTLGSIGCNLEFQLDLQSLRAAGIVPVFAAGNFGSGASTSASPGNNPEAFAVGATSNSDLIWSGSSRGPSACGEPQTTYPELVAPGVNVRSSDLFGLYGQQTGTSLAAPHVAGALALLLDAYPNLGVDAQEQALGTGAVDLGFTGPDDTYGFGRLDILAAYQSVTPPPPPNEAPVVDAGSDQVVTLPAAAILDATVSEDGLPSGTLTTLWATQSGPGSVTFGNATAVDTMAGFSAPGTYVLRLTADDGALSAFDELRVTVNPTPPIFADGFESGDTSAWSAEVDAENDLSVSEGAALAGARGLKALIDNGTSMYVRDDSPSAETAYSVHFLFDPNGMRMGDGDTHRIMVARDNQVDLVRVDFRRTKAGSYQLSASVRTDAGSYLATSWFTISDAPHPVEVTWLAATGVGTLNGSMSLQVDGSTKQTLAELDNDLLRVEQARLGPLEGIDARTRGAEFFDDFVSSR